MSEYSASIIVVCTNELHHIRRCLPSLLRQDHPSYEVIVVDNASSDGSPEYIRALCDDHANLRLVSNPENLGYVGANNVGFESSAADILVVLNPDTDPEPSWLSELLKPFDMPDVGLTTSKIVMMHDRSSINTCGIEMSVTSLAVCRGLGQPATAFSEPTDVIAVSGAAFAIRKRVLDAIGGFDSAFFIYYEDTDLSLRAWLAGYRCVYVPTSIVAHDYIFKFSPKKAFWQERNRYFALLKTFRWRTLIVLAPWLLLGDLIALIYCALSGSAHIWSKLRTYAWLAQHWNEIMTGRRRTQSLRAVTDATLLRNFTAQISIAGAVEGRIKSIIEAGLYPVLRLGTAVSSRITW